MTMFFSYLTEYCRIWRNDCVFGHMPIFGSIWRQVACLKNIDKYWKHTERLLKSCKIGQYWKDIETILKTYWNHICVMITPACVQLRIRNLGMPYDQTKYNISRWGSRYYYTNSIKTWYIHIKTWYDLVYSTPTGIFQHDRNRLYRNSMEFPLLSRAPLQWRLPSLDHSLAYK